MFTDASFQACCRYGKQRTTQQAFTPCKRRVTERERAKEIRQVSGVACVCAPPSSLSGLDWIPREAGVLLYIINAGGVPTRRAHTHTQMGRPTYEAPTVYSRVHTNTHTHTHTARPDKAHSKLSSAPYFVGPRCVRLCVCVCVCVFVCVLSSRCLVCRPSHLRVCRVGTPPAG